MRVARAVVALCLMGVAGVVAGYATHGALRTWLADGGFTAASAAAVAGCLVATRRVDAGRLGGWRLMATASGCWLVGQLLWDGITAASAAPAPPAAPDLLWLAFPVIASLAVRRAAPSHPSTRRYGLIDLTMVVVGSAALAVTVNVDGIERTGLGLAGTITSVGYGVLYLGFAGLLVLSLLRRLRVGIGADQAMLLAGALLEAAGFALWAPQLLDGTYAVGHSVVDVLWALGLCAIAGAGLLAARGRTPPPLSERDLALGAIVPGALLLAMLAMLPVFATRDGEEAEVLVLGIGSGVVAALLIVRQILLGRRQLDAIEHDRAARADAQRAREDLERFLALAPIMLCRQDLGGRFTWVNPAFTHTLGWTEDELLSRPMLSFIHPDDLALAQDEVAALATGHATVDFQIRMRCADGGSRTVLWSAVPLPDGRTVYGAGRDVTALDAAQESLRRSNADLERFAYAASHDLAEPLRTIQAYSGLVLEDNAASIAPHSAAHLGTVVEASLRMRTLLDGLLTVSRAGTAELQRRDVDLRDVVEGTVRILDRRVRETGAAIEVGDLPVVRGDEQQLGQLVQNLLGNALKFIAGAAPRVVVDGARENGGWHVWVADNGIGIDERHRAGIFDMFARLHGRGEYEGSGMGLALCAKIAERHGGRIWVESEPGAGSTFHVTIADDRAEEAPRP